jgi:hypothetical protein
LARRVGREAPEHRRIYILISYDFSLDFFLDFLISRSSDLLLALSLSLFSLLSLSLSFSSGAVLVSQNQYITTFLRCAMNHNTARFGSAMFLEFSQIKFVHGVCNHNVATLYGAIRLAGTAGLVLDHATLQVTDSWFHVHHLPRVPLVPLVPLENSRALKCTGVIRF